MKNKLLADMARLLIGIDITPEDVASDEVGCSESVSKLLHLLFPAFPQGILSTATLKKELDKSKLFVRIDKPKAGCVVVSPRTRTVNGHTGIYITDTKIVSNSSANGKMEQNYTTTSWKKTFEVGRGLSTFYYALK